MLSTHMDVEPKQRSGIKKQLISWLIFSLPLVAAFAWSQKASSGGFWGEGGPWRALTNLPECSSLGRVCAEWPFDHGGLEYLAVCCIVPGDLGSTKPPDEACGAGGMLMVRRANVSGLTW